MTGLTAQTAYQMFEVLVRDEGVDAAWEWAENNLTDEEIAEMQKYAKRVEKSKDRNWHIMTLGK